MNAITWAVILSPDGKGGFAVPPEYADAILARCGPGWRIDDGATSSGGTMPKIDEAVEMLRCAEINCDNVPKIGPQMVQVVKAQIQSAIQLLDEAPITKIVAGESEK